MAYVPSTIYRTVYDINFTAESSQTFSADQNYTMGGATWVKQGTSYEDSAASVGSGGLVIRPNQTSDWNITGSGRNLPMLKLPIKNAFSGFSMPSRLRVWAYNPSNDAANNYEDAVITVGSGDSTLEFVVKRGRGLSGNGLSPAYTSTVVRGNNYLDNVMTLGTSNDVIVFDIPSLYMANFKVYYGAYTANGWPGLGSMSLALPWDYYASNLVSASILTALASDKVSVCLGAQRSGSGTAYTVRFDRLRIDVG